MSYSGTGVTYRPDHLPDGGAPGDVLILGPGGKPFWAAPAGGGGGGDMIRANNLSDVANVLTSRTSLGLGVADSPVFGNLTVSAKAIVTGNLAVGRNDTGGSKFAIESTNTQQAWIYNLATNAYATLTVDPGGSVTFIVGAPAGAYFLQTDHVIASNKLSCNGVLDCLSLTTDLPGGGAAPAWKLGNVATVTPTAPNRTIAVEIGGVIYYIAAKTTNN